MSDESPAITIDQLNVFIGAHHALKDVTLTVAHAAVLAVLGHAGAGKTTLLRAITRLITPDEDTAVTGSVRFDWSPAGPSPFVAAGHNPPREDDCALRRRVAYVPTEPQVFNTSIWDNVTFGPRMAGRRNRAELDAVVERSLTRVALWDEIKDRLRRPAAALSAGQQQRLCTARALSNDPRVVLFDDPLRSLDPLAARKMEDVINQLGDECAVVVTTRMIATAGRLADSIAVLLDGAIREHGSVNDVLTNPRTASTIEYLSGRYRKEPS